MKQQKKKSEDLIIQKVKIVELTLEDGSKFLCRAGEAAVARAWKNYPVVSAEYTGKEEIMQYWDPNE